MKLNPPVFQIIVIVVFTLVTSPLLSENGFADGSSYSVSNPDFEGKATSAIVDEKTNKVYITDFFGEKLIVLDGNTDEIIESIKIVRTPFGVGINSETGKIYVGGEFANTLSILDAKTNQVIEDITLEDPYDIAVDPNNNTVYVTSDRSNAVYVIDGESNEIRTSFEVLIPCGIAVNPITGLVYVTSESKNQVHVWDGNTNQQIATISVQESPRGVTVNQATNIIYVTNQEDNTISVIDGEENKVIKSIDVGETPRRVVSDWQSNIIYVSNQGSKNISVIDGAQNKVIETIPVKEPFELAINSESGKLYSMYYGGELSIITKSKVLPSPLKQFSKGIDPHEVVCIDGFSLVFKNSNFSPACVKPSSVSKLIERGWASDHNPEQHQMMMNK